MAAPKYTPQLQLEYQYLFDTCIIKPETYPEVDGYIKAILNGKLRYDAVAAAVNIPWYFIGLAHCMEGNCDFTTHLHNGDPLTARTVQVPKGRPLTGTPPFTWEFSAEDALLYEGLDKWTDWGIPGILYKLEGYNGYGYRSLQPPINSPYLWSYSNQYTKGKFVKDGVYSSNAVSKQCGAGVLLRRLYEKQLITAPIDRIALIKQLGTTVNYAPNRYVAKAEALQKLLNQNGAIIKVDGKAGQISSDAYKAITGTYLTSDPRII